MPFFTIILEHAGGTYLAQGEGSRAREAVSHWARNLPTQVTSATGATAKDFSQALVKSRGARIRGLRNVWCFSGLVRNELALVHVVQTDA